MAAEHSIDERRLGVGLAGWQDDAWVQHYFPSDLPLDWRLSYYANEHDCVLLDEGDWVTADPAEWAEWADAVGEGFRFYLAAESAGPARLDALAEAFGEHLGGVLLASPVEGVPAAMWPDPGLEVPAWRNAAGNRLFKLDIAGMDMRAQRALLETLAPAFGDNRRHDLILTGTGVGPAEAASLRVLSELLGLA